MRKPDFSVLSAKLRKLLKRMSEAFADTYKLKSKHGTAPQSEHHNFSMTKRLDIEKRARYNIITKYPEQFLGGEAMHIEELASVRTGLVTARKKSKENQQTTKKYSLLNLKCINSGGYLNTDYSEEYSSAEILKSDYFTQRGDILVRLSAPYTAVMIKEDSECGYLVPSHFAIIRVDKAKALPEYVLWFLKRESTLQKILQNSSGSSAFGTISSGFLASLKIREIPLEKQAIVGQLLLLSEKEQELLHKLAAQKEIYNRELVNQIYDSFKRGN